MFFRVTVFCFVSVVVAVIVAVSVPMTVFRFFVSVVVAVNVAVIRTSSHGIVLYSTVLKYRWKLE